jgi:hypothetical protein
MGEDRAFVQKLVAMAKMFDGKKNTFSCHNFTQIKLPLRKSFAIYDMCHIPDERG